uniref:Late endosomal/lysosomal adaptor and MAPK and MTOR activator 1 n=1 Tax=Caenorhabditis japonica TaxID=281687 RepID=A0A8R1DGY5_CAEJA
MDDLFRLFCGCCGMQPADPQPPYGHLRSDSVTPIRDPPLPYLNGHQQQQHGFDNPVHEFSFDATDAPHPYAQPPRQGIFTDSPSPPSGRDLDEEVEDEKMEKELLDNIVENTQHSIIAVGQTDVDGMIVQDMQHREAAYKKKTQKMTTGLPAVKCAETYYDFEIDPQQTPIQVPMRYDEMSSTIEASPIERMPFSHPDFNHVKLARPMGHQNPLFLAEHPDMNRAGRSQSISTSMRAKITEVLDEVHQGVVGIEVEPRDLIVSMDF